jgi:hypothetical protein
MSLRSSLLPYVPDRALRRLVLDRLYQATAEAFGTAAPRRDGRRFDDRLAAYAAFTAAQAEKALAADEADPDRATALMAQEQLHRRATDLGSTLRRRLGIRRPDEALRALEFLYRQIGIDMGGRLQPESAGAYTVPIEVTRCFFAGCYSESICRVIGALDAGVVNGLFGGASLEFSQRLTDGSRCCQAIIRSAEAQ